MFLRANIGDLRHDLFLRARRAGLHGDSDMREIKFRFFEDVGEHSKMWYDPILLLIENEDDKLYTAWDVLNGAFTNVKIMQFTGLKDKNGKEIYEDDVVQGQNWKKEKQPPRIVKFDHQGCLADGLWVSAISECEVIGNIYENPELLK